MNRQNLPDKDLLYDWMRNSVAPHIALRMLFYNPARFLTTMVGIGFAFFLASAQVGLLIGWMNTISALITHTAVDLWVMAEQTPAFDYGTAIPRHRIQQVLSVPGVDWAEGLFMAWNVWQHKNGKRINVEVVGLDESNVGGPWDMREGSIDTVHIPDTVIVDELYTTLLGISQRGDEFEMTGERVRVGGISQGIRTFTASPFIFTSIKSAIKYDKRYHDDEITYVIARCSSGIDAVVTKQRILAEVSHVEVLTSTEFAWRTIQYWIMGTGIGITVIITAILGLVIGAVIISQTLFAITQDHLANYATLLALGFHQTTLRTIVFVQSIALGLPGIVLGGSLFKLAGLMSARTPIPIEMTPLVFLSLIVLTLLCCVIASWASIRSIFQLDPVMVFHR